ncbi:MAG: hypothetical protein H3C63_03010 [Candidatus Omnitrophica bacterium]|nr:hypothetical protein [Candidatus Omnitrophota bacterium]
MALTRINNNITALNALRSYSVTAEDLRTSLERLSSGLRINRAADDAAGLTIAENLRLQVTGINQAVENSSDAINLVNTAEGALSETTARLQRIRTLALQAANLGANDSVTLQAIQQEIDSSIQEISRIANDTQFASQHLLNGEKNNSVSIVAGDSLGIRTNPESYSSTLSTGKHHLKITRTVAGSETVHNGADGVLSPDRPSRPALMMWWSPMWWQRRLAWCPQVVRSQPMEPARRMEPMPSMACSSMDTVSIRMMFCGSLWSNRMGPAPRSMWL